MPGVRVDEQQLQTRTVEVEWDRPRLKGAAVEEECAPFFAQHRGKLVHRAGWSPGEVVLGTSCPCRDADPVEAQIQLLVDRGADGAGEGGRRGQAGARRDVTADLDVETTDVEVLLAKRPDDACDVRGPA